MATLLRLLLLFGIGSVAYVAEVVLVDLLVSKPIDPMAEGFGFLIYVAAFAVAVLAVPGVIAPRPSEHALLRIGAGALIFPAVYFSLLAVFFSELTTAELLIALCGLPPGLAVMTAAPIWPLGAAPNYRLERP
jgi:hypothetical protein